MGIATREKTEFNTEIFKWYVAGALVDTYEVKEDEIVTIEHEDCKAVITFYNKERKRVMAWAVQKVERIVLPTGIGGLDIQLDGPVTSLSKMGES